MVVMRLGTDYITASEHTKDTKKGSGKSLTKRFMRFSTGWKTKRKADLPADASGNLYIAKAWKLSFTLERLRHSGRQMTEAFINQDPDSLHTQDPAILQSKTMKTASSSRLGFFIGQNERRAPIGQKT